MRRDVVFFFQKDVVSVFNAYIAAATNQQFRRQCRQEPYHTIGFGLNFSMKYNMNGGSCTIRFIPYNNGTAINMRFSIAQAIGARYNAYALDLTNTVSQILGMPSQNISLDVNIFLDDRNKVFAQGQPMPQGAPRSVPVQTAPPPVQRPAPQTSAPPVQRYAEPNTIYATPQPIIPQPTATKKFCAGCGTPVDQNQKFCAKCGRKLI